jgi:hypothetical protein
MPVFDEQVCEQVEAAIYRCMARDEPPGEPLLRSFTVVAFTLAFGAVQCLAEERSVSIEAVLDDLIGAQ